MAGEVLEGAGHAPLVESLHRRGHQICRLGEIVAVGPVADNGVFGVGPYVCHRGKVHVEPQGRHVRRNDPGVFRRFPHPLILVLEHGADIGGAHGGHQPVYPSPLLVTGQKQGDPGVGLDGRQHIPHLFLAGHVGAVIDQPAYRVLFQGQPGGLACLRHLIRPGQVHRKHHEQLADLLPEGHSLQKLLGGGGLRFRRRLRDRFRGRLRFLEGFLRRGRVGFLAPLGRQPQDACANRPDCQDGHQPPEHRYHTGVPFFLPLSLGHFDSLPVPCAGLARFFPILHHAVPGRKPFYRREKEEYPKNTEKSKRNATQTGRNVLSLHDQEQKNQKRGRGV